MDNSKLASVPLFNEVIEARGEDEIDQNTAERKTRKAAEAEEKKQRDTEHARARKLEDLFNYKLEVFETEEIKDSKNRKMRAWKMLSSMVLDLRAGKEINAELLHKIEKFDESLKNRLPILKQFRSVIHQKIEGFTFCPWRKLVFHYSQNRLWIHRFWSDRNPGIF